jgi:site-specific recombinase XerD
MSMKNKADYKTLTGLIDQYRISNQADNKSPKTVEWYYENLTSFIIYLEKENLGTALSVFNINSVRDYVLYLHNKPRFANQLSKENTNLLSPKTVQCHVRTLKAFSSWLYRNEYTKDNILSKLKIPKAPEKITQPLTPEETKRTLKVNNRKTPTGNRNYAIVTLMLDTGVRESETSSLSISQVNLDKNCLKVMGKGAKERMVPFGDYCRIILLEYIENWRPAPANKNIDNLFLTSDGKPLSANAIKLLFSRLKKTTGIKRLHAHLCRHTFATNYLLNGGDVFTLKEILGHTTLEMVNSYLHFTTSQLAVLHHQFSPMDKLQRT